jgi:GxxExxY protein
MGTESEKYDHCLYHDLTDILIGFAFDIFRQVGPRYPEKIYQNAFENKLKDAKIRYQRENYCKVEVDGRRVGSFKLDFLIDGKIIIELKVRNQLYNKDIAQVLTYMQTNDIKLGLILLFTSSKVEIKRLIL